MTTIPPKAEKLLRLALDGAACQGEWENAARMFVAILRKAGCQADALLAAPSRYHSPPPPQGRRRPEPPPWKAKPTRMPFGCHKGELLSAIPTDYLEWLTTLANLKPELRNAVEAELSKRP